MSLNPLAWSFRAQYLSGFLICVGLLAYAYFVQFAQGIEPCDKCILQRIAFIVIALCFLAGAIQNPRATGRRVYSLLLLLIAFVGAGVALRHIWIQHQPPDQLAGCGPGLNYMIENFPLNKALKMAFMSGADCAQITWTFLGLSMPYWTLSSYVLLGAGALWASRAKQDRSSM